MSAAARIPCPYCKALVTIATPTDPDTENRQRCGSCGSRMGVRLAVFRRGKGPAIKAREAQAAAAAEAELVMMGEYIAARGWELREGRWWDPLTGHGYGDARIPYESQRRRDRENGGG